jgi:hypothetical protein
MLKKEGTIPMHPRRYALIGGIIMLAMGVISLIPSLSQMPADLPFLKLDLSYGLFLDLFPMNIVNKVALIVFGLLGIFASRATNTSLPASIRFSRLVFFVMGAGAILGAIPQTQTFFGYWPLFGAEVWVHGIFAVLGAYFGYALPMKAAPRAAAV